MGENTLILDVDWLRANAVKTHFFGLGFIQVKLNDLERVHFYHRDIPAFVEEPHDHRYDFISTVLRGCLQNRIWKLTDGDDYEVTLETCKQGEPSKPIVLMKTGIELFGSFDVHEGSGYHMNSLSFHTVHPFLERGPVVTSVKRELPRESHARVIRRVNAPSACPFSRPMPDAELWEVVRDCVG